MYTLNYHSLTELLIKENELSGGLFPNGFFSSKIGSMFIIWLLIKIFGAGWLSLYILQFIFALLLIGFFFLSFKFCMELTDSEDLVNSQWALTASIIVLFLPVTMYLSFKTLTEVPALFFSTFGLWMFMRSIRETVPKKICMQLSLALIGVALGTICRFIFLLNFIGLVFSYVVIYRQRYPIKIIIHRASIIFTGLFVLFIFIFSIIGDHLVQSAGPLKDIIMNKRGDGGGIKLYVLMMYFQFFIILLPFSVLFKWNRPFKLSILWLSTTVIPLFIAASNLEPRFLSIGLIPTAIIINQGLQNFVKALRLDKKIIVPIALALIVILNRFVFTPISFYEIDQKQFRKIVSDVYKHEPRATLILPWITDYCFLKFVYPDKQIRSSITTFSRTGENKSFIQSDAFQWWIGRNNHVSTSEELKNQSKPWIYIGRSFSPAREKLYEYLSFLHINSFMQRTGDDIPLSASWIWNNADLKLDISHTQGPYNAYRIEPSQGIIKN
ncbi:MAG: hypothetical protein R6V76_12275 [Desulfobacterales bacterium]